MQEQAGLCRGKAKAAYGTESPDLLVPESRDGTPAGDGARIEQFDRKGMANNKLDYLIMNRLAEAGTPTQMGHLLSDTECLVKKLDMVPTECIVHNRAAGSLVGRLGIEEGIELNPPLSNPFLRNDAMHDPIVNKSYCGTFGWMSKENLARMKELTCKASNVLKGLFNNAGLILVGFKLEFDLCKGEVVLGDEFSPGDSRLQNKETLEEMDKDRFRQNLDGLTEAYEAVAHHLDVQLD